MYMATTATEFPADAQRVRATGYPVGGVRFDWISAALAAWVTGGLFVDGWAHSHGFVDNTFFTPWHAILYSGALSTTLFLSVNQWRNIGKGYPFGRALPRGYLLSLIGAGLFIASGGADLLWHELFGFEVNIETLLSPAHLLLAVSGILMLSGPIRAAWARYRAGEAHGWRYLGPALLTLTLCLAILLFLTQFVNATNDNYAAANDQPSITLYSDLYSINADGTGQTRLTSETGTSFWGGAWSPDGSQIVYTKGAVAQNANEGNLYIGSADSSQERELTTMPGSEYIASWSPDGSQIVFINNHDGSTDIYAIDTDGSNLRQMSDTASGEYLPVFSPDGSQILFQSNRSGAEQIYIMDADGGNVRQLTAGGEPNWGASWSPNGSRIIFSGQRGSNLDLYLINADGSSETRLTFDPAADYWPQFSPDGSQLVFISWRSGTSNLWVLDAACLDDPQSCDETAVNLSNNTALDILLPRWSPDGSQVLFTANGHSLTAPQYLTEALGVAGVLVQAALIMGVTLLAIKQWQLPFGSMLLMFGLTGALMTVFRDRFGLIPYLLAAGLLIDILLLIVRPVAEPQHKTRYYLFAFIAPVVYFSLYFLAVQLSDGIGWTLHLWLGTIVVSGLIGVLLALLLLPPFVAPEEQATDTVLSQS
jgi:Tol biopolymer transport system component